MFLSPIDWMIIAGYLVVCTVAGIRMRKYVTNVDDFAVAAREVETSLGVASLAATEVGIVTVVYTAQMGFTNGPAGATPGVLTAVAMLLVGLTGFVIVPLREARVMTIPELFEKRFGTRVRWLAGLVVILGGLLNMGVFLRAGGDFLLHVTGVSTLAGFEVAVLGHTISLGYLELMMTGLLAIVLVYTVLGGMLSVLITDFLQFIVMGAGIVIVSLMVVWYIPWPEFISGLSEAHEAGQRYAQTAKLETQQMEAAARTIAQTQGKQAADAFLAARTQKQGEDLKAAAGELAKQSVLVDTKSNPARPLTMAHPFNPFASEGLGFGWVLWQAMTAIAVVTTWQTTIARVLAARDANTAKKIYRGTWFYFVGRFCLPGLWGAGAFLYFSANGGLPAGAASDTAMAEFLRIILPTGLIGILLAAMLAAEMSTDSGYLLTWSTVIYNDLITPCLRRPLSDRARLVTIRFVVVAIGLFLIFWGLWYEMSGSVWEYLAVTGNIYLASLFSLLVGALYWRGANSWGATAAIILGACGPLTFLVINAVVGKDSPYRIPGEVAGLAAFGLAFAGLIGGSLLGRAVGKGAPTPAQPIKETGP